MIVRVERDQLGIAYARNPRIARVFDGKQSIRYEEFSDLWGKGELLDHSLSELLTIRRS